MRLVRVNPATDHEIMRHFSVALPYIGLAWGLNKVYGSVVVRTTDRVTNEGREVVEVHLSDQKKHAYYPKS